MNANPQPTKSFSTLSWLGWFIGFNLIWIAMAAAAVWLGWRSYTLTTGGETTTGTVVRLIEDDINSFTTDVTPVFQFQVNGEAYEVRSQNMYGWWNRYFRFKEGREVEVRFDPANPELAEVNSLWDIWLEAILLGIFSIIFAVGVNVYFLYRWRNRQT